MAPGLSRLGLIGAALLAACGGGAALTGVTPPTPAPPAPNVTAGPGSAWSAATVYFLLLDRFFNGDPANDGALGRLKDGGLLRNFEGGDLKGVLQQIEAGYFDSLGVTAIWMTPFVEQIHAAVDEGAGKTYAFHGYWARDWTAVDPAFGTRADLQAVVDAAHRHGIRVLMDAVVNHTGPSTPLDSAWPAAWVRTGPNCTYTSYVTTVTCTLVSTLPDVRTESDSAVALPPFLTAKWAAEGRLAQEQASLDAFFARTGYPRAPKYYLIKWLTDWVRAYGIDGYRVDTAKHFEERVSLALRREANVAFADWKAAHPAQVLDTASFFMVGEVYGWAPQGGRAYSFGDASVDYFTFGYDALINFAFKADTAALDDLYTRYGLLTSGSMQGVAFLNYNASHDDGAPWDPDRSDPFRAANRLLLAPGGAQIYYGDETARPLRVPGATGDANLRSFMNWGDVAAGGSTARILDHWRKLGRFRKAHPAIGAGEHRRLQASPYIFSRALALPGGKVDRVLVALGLPEGAKTVPVFGTFAEGTDVVDAYSGVTGTVRNGGVGLWAGSSTVLLAPR